MKIAVLGTGMVGRAISAKLTECGHEVMLGTREVSKTLAHNEPDGMGNPPFHVWYEQHSQIKLGTFAEAGAFGELLFNCTAGGVSLEVLKAVGESNLNGKILIDIANTLDFSRGMPPTLSVANTDSLAEQIQRAYPQLKVVKSLNTMNAYLMVNPALLPAEHDVFVSGNDAEAKAQVAAFLKDNFGWKSVIDLGDIQTARGAEMMLPIWLSLFGALQTPMFNFKVVR
ncbi:MAG TPA: NAD(P)-binding domain-containing protein [Aggregatilineales bacterium]|nr:NAD(P)-binding domain-containing protein [Anaerolineales bacterium]HRE48022.1 NAD(P)-binding domain-containing protein [Aggregatilineales bacterium]